MFFSHKNSNATWTFSINDFTIPNTNINIKSKQDIFNYSSEKKVDMSEKVKSTTRFNTTTTIYRVKSYTIAFKKSKFKIFNACIRKLFSLRFRKYD